MGYLAYVIALVALVLSDTQGMTINQGVDKLLDDAVGINQFFLWLILGFWALGLFLSLFEGFRRNAKSCLGCGCITFLLVFLPPIHFIIWQVNVGLANSFGPSGPTDPVQFWALVALTVFMGAA